MTCTQRLMKPGTFRVALKTGTPTSITSAIDVLDHVVITPTRLTPLGQFSDANILAAAVYTGVIVARPSRLTMEGHDPSWWLGTPTGRGVRSTALTRAASTLSEWVANILPHNGITAGTITNTGLASSAGTYQFVTRREMLDAVCRLAGAEWIAQPDFTVDAAAPATLFRVTTPQVVVTRQRGGPEGVYRGVESTMLVSGKDAANLATKATVVAQGQAATIATGEASEATSYKTPANGTIDLEFLVNAPSTTDANADALAAAVLASAGALKTTLGLSTRSWLVPLWLKPGDYVYAYDIEAGLVDTTNQIHYRGELITPAKVRCHAITWPIEAGMGVYVRRSSTGVYTDISDWFEAEDADTHWEIGTSDLAEAAPGQVAYLGANADVEGRRWAGYGNTAAFTVQAKQNGNRTSTTVDLTYGDDGAWIDAHFDAIVTAAGTAGNEFKLTPTGLPAPATSRGRSVGSATYFRTGVGNITCDVIWDGTDLRFLPDEGTILGISPSFACANNDEISGTIRFQRA